MQCEICGAVFHAQCLNEQQPCPKCERRRKREELDLEEANFAGNAQSLSAATTENAEAVGEVGEVQAMH